LPLLLDNFDFPTGACPLRLFCGVSVA
jgi:hypothetical protein